MKFNRMKPSFKNRTLNKKVVNFNTFMTFRDKLAQRFLFNKKNVQ